MTKEQYLVWRNTIVVADKASDTVVELTNGRVFEIHHRPMPDNGWVATHEDVTQRYLAEKALTAAKASAERAEQEAQAAHATLIDALDVVPEGLAIFDAEDRFVLWNRRYAELYAGSDTLQPGMRFEDTLRAGLARGQYPDAKGREEEWLRKRLALHTQPQSAHEQQLSSDRWLRIEERRMADGGIIGVRIDITDLKRREASFRLLFDSNPIPMWVYDRDSLKFLAVNEAAIQHYGFSREAFLTMSLLDIRPREDWDKLRQAAHSSVDTHRAGVPWRHIKADGTVIEVETYGRSLQYGEQRASLVAIIDVTERKHAELRIGHMARHDALTDLPNRTALDDQFASAIDAAQTSGGTFAILCMDLDRFKEVNDLFGHSVGDAVLREVARRLQAASGDAFLARVGGDEFVAIMSEGGSRSRTEALADRLRTCLHTDIDVVGHSFQLNISIGIAVFPRDGHDTTTLLSNADAALYRAKHDGRGTSRFFTPAMDQQLRDRRALERDLRSAIERGELSLDYQPQSSAGREIIGFEALARWQHPERGSVPPGEFIPIAEESDLIVEIGEWVLREACREAASWPRPLQIAVNVSAVQFRRGNLRHTVHAILLETGLPPDRLELEITEGVLIENVSRTASILRSLKALGVRIALDDFGTGYSSLSYLQSFPLDRIKIDRTFVAKLGRTDGSLAIVRAVIGLAHGLNLPVLAEGVETNDQLAILCREGCDHIQGYLIGRPRPIGTYQTAIGCEMRLAGVS